LALSLAGQSNTSRTVTVVADVGGSINQSIPEADIGKHQKQPGRTCRRSLGQRQSVRKSETLWQRHGKAIIQDQWQSLQVLATVAISQYQY
jgi:hypothetical protein